MTDVEPRNNLGWRVRELERKVDRLEGGKPDVIAEQVRALRDDQAALRAELRREVEVILRTVREGDEKNSNENASLRRILVGFCTALAIGLITVYVTSGGNLAS